MRLRLLQFFDERQKKYQTIDSREQNFKDRVMGFLVMLVYPTLIHVMCVPSYFHRPKNGFDKAKKATCGYLYDSYDHYAARRRKTLIAVALLGPLFGLTQLDSQWLDSFFQMKSVRSVQASAFFDGTDWEVQTWDYLTNFHTDNTVDDRAPSAGGPIAVWQTQTEQGSEIMYWDLVIQEPFALTQNEVDDVEPKTDGRFVVWRRYDEGIWRVYLIDFETPPYEEKLVSTQGTASDLTIRNGVIAWQEWIDEDWEIMTWRPGLELQRITFNQTPDLTPFVMDDFLVWEGQDPVERDREIFRFDFSSGEVSRVTDNAVNDDALRVVGQEIYWYERRGDVSAQMKLRLGEIHPQVIEIVSPPAPLPKTDLNRASTPEQGASESEPVFEAPTQEQPVQDAPIDESAAITSESL